MILDGDTTAAGATLDELFRRAGVRAPQAPALADPPNRASFTDGAPRTLTYAEADRAISALAARLHGLGLKTDAVVALQLPNTVEGVIALLGVLRAGMIAAPLPLLWRQQEIVAALRGIGAKTIITCARAGAEQPAKTAMLAAAELFPIRHVCAFGRDLPDGIVPLDAVFAADASDLVHAALRPGPAAAHVAVVTFDVTTAGVVPVARNAAQLLAGGLGVSLEAGLAPQADILSTIPPASFAGIALGVVPWLLAGGTLALHHGCDPKTLEAQCEVHDGATLILPGPALAPLSEAGCLLAFKTILALWRAPERLAASALWYRAATLIDVAAFGETGLVAGKRAADGKPVPIRCGGIGAPRGAAGALTVLETARTRGGTVALRGPMVPTHPFPAGAPLSPDGYSDTGFTCVAEGQALAVTAAPAGITMLGGYRFAQAAMDATVAEADPAASIMAVPDGLLGEHMAGHAPDPQALIATLQARGVNPLIAGAFRRHLRIGAA
jgi:AMP-binding enzyme